MPYFSTLIDNSKMWFCHPRLKERKAKEEDQEEEEEEEQKNDDMD